MTPAVPTTTPIAGRWSLEQLLGHGGMADVYRATDAGGGPPVAVKMVRSTDPVLARRVTREARAVAGFDHSGLVRLVDAGVHDRHPFLVMELVEGPTLAERLRRGPLTTGGCAALGSSLADALAYVHRRGVVHRDVKPANVLLGPGQRVRLADFGIAQVLDASTATVTGATLGTAAYMAPEQLADHRVGPAADVWALGALLLECLTGRRTFEGSPAEVVGRRLAGALPRTDTLPATWRLVLDAMLDSDPGRRPGAGELSELLRSPVFTLPWDPRPTQAIRSAMPTEGVTEGDGAKSPPTPAVPTVPDPRLRGAPAMARRPGRDLRRVAAVAAVVLAVVLAGSLGAWALIGSSAQPGRHRDQASTTATSTTTTTTTTTTAPPVTVASASAALVNAVESGVTSGALSRDVAQSILDQLGQALAAQTQGNVNGEESALGNLDKTITNADGAGKVTAAETQTLLADVSTLGGAMGVTSPSSTTTTTAPSASGGPGAKGPGKSGH